MAAKAVFFVVPDTALRREWQAALLSLLGGSSWDCFLSFSYFHSSLWHIFNTTVRPTRGGNPLWGSSVRAKVTYSKDILLCGKRFPGSH